MLISAMVEKKKPQKSVLLRITHAWEPLKSSFAVHLFGFATIVEVLGSGFEWHRNLAEVGLWPSWAPAVNAALYAVCVVFFLRAMFLLAEKNGELIEDVERKKKKLKAHVEMGECLHNVIHSTRDALLSGSGFIEMLSMDDDERLKRLWETWEVQLALVQRAMRCVTDSDCNVCIKVIKKNGFAPGCDGLVTICYGPAVLTERRKKSLVLPLNQGIAQEALVVKDIAFTSDILQDDRFWPREERQKYSIIYRTVVASPILVNGEARGVLCLDWSEPNKYDPSSHRPIIAAFTDIISTACYLYDLPSILLEEIEEGPTNEQTSGDKGSS